MLPKTFTYLLTMVVRSLGGLHWGNLTNVFTMLFLMAWPSRSASHAAIIFDSHCISMPYCRKWFSISEGDFYSDNDSDDNGKTLAIWSFKKYTYICCNGLGAGAHCGLGNAPHEYGLEVLCLCWLLYEMISSMLTRLVTVQYTSFELNSSTVYNANI